MNQFRHRAKDDPGRGSNQATDDDGDDLDLRQMRPWPHDNMRALLSLYSAHRPCLISLTCLHHIHSLCDELTIESRGFPLARMQARDSDETTTRVYASVHSTGLAKANHVAQLSSGAEFSSGGCVSWSTYGVAQRSEAVLSF